jgi:GT2 family glycosyltransferase/glycosyltransferase involved in cell wall biosynthesis
VASIPLVSIVIPASNPEFFPSALQDALAQTYEHLEIIVCDDSLTDEIEKNCAAQAATSSVPVFYSRNAVPLGFVRNVRQGFDKAQGEMVKILCDDDRLYTECVTLQTQALVDYADVNLVVAQRFFCDRAGIRLPDRTANMAIAPSTGMFVGVDLLTIFDTYPFNFLGNLSSALFRRADVAPFLEPLTDAEPGFANLLDLALFVCLLRHGNLVCISEILVIERLYPQRLSRQPAMQSELAREREWMTQMLAERKVEGGPDVGWVRFVPLGRANESPRPWEEIGLSRTMALKSGFTPYFVGTRSESFVELLGEWLACRVLDDTQRNLLSDNIAAWSHRPRIVPIVVDRDDDRAGTQMTLDSIAAQDYPADLVLLLSTGCSEPQLEGNIFTLPLQEEEMAQLNALLAQIDGADWIYLLRSGDRLPPPALLTMADRIVANPGWQCLYGDEAALVDGQAEAPVFKPDFNLDLLRSYPYTGRALAFKRDAVLALDGFQPAFGELARIDLLWRIFEHAGSVAIGHVCEILLEASSSLGKWLAAPEVIALNLPVTQAHLQRLGIAHECEGRDGVLLHDIHYLHPQRPLVSIIIVSRNQLALVQRSVERLLGNTHYGHFEVVLVNNASTSAQARAWFNGMAALGEPRLRVVETETHLSESAAVNHGAAQAAGEYLVIFSPWLVVTEGDWLDRMMQLAQRPEVAVVGPKLLSANGSFYHAGLILGLHGGWASPFNNAAADAPGYMQRLQVTQGLSAVGKDCLLVRRDVFDTLGGLDEDAFAHAAQEVDFCLRARELGMLVLWTPFAQLAIGDRQRSDAEREAFQVAGERILDRWLPIVARDPAYNPNLNLSGQGFELEPGECVGWNALTTVNLPNVMGVPVNPGAVGHYRVIQPLHELQIAGRARGRIRYLMPSIIEVERQNPDVIVLQGRYFDGADKEVGNLRRYFDSRLIYELDDLVTNVPKKNDHARDLPDTLINVMRRTIAFCDRVVVSTEPLANALSSMHQDIRVVPNMLSTQLWSGLKGRRRTTRKPRVGWGGGTSHRGDLELIADVVRLLADEVEWVFFGMCPDSLRPFVHEFHGVIKLSEYPAKLASLNLDLALAPLEFHIFNDCKSNLRLLEYGACGYPVICSDTAAYGGYLPCTRVKTNSTEEWLEAIRMHLADPEASYRMGDALRETVLRDYMMRADNVQHWASAWLGD